MIAGDSADMCTGGFTGEALVSIFSFFPSDELVRNCNGVGVLFALLVSMLIGSFVRTNSKKAFVLLKIEIENRIK